MARHAGVARAALIVLAALAAIVPRPPALVERVYSAGLYPFVQRVLTSVSNIAPVALFDVVLVAAVLWTAWRWAAAIGGWRRRTWRPTGVAVRSSVTLAAAAYLWFVVVWGLNYARPPLEQRLALPPIAVTADDVARLLERTVTAVNTLADAAHAEASTNDETEVAAAIERTDAKDGRPRAIVPGHPKRTILAPYFRMAGVDGLTAPFALETLLNPDLTPMEQPFVLAHEWAHLSGHADEADANFVAWEALSAAPSPRLQYSAWLFLLSETAGQVSAERRRPALSVLADGPRADLAAIAARARQRVDLVERVGWRVYDRYLRAQGVADGVRSYSRVVQLVVRARSRDGEAGRR